MFGPLTKQEQTVIVSLVLLMAAGFGYHQFARQPAMVPLKPTPAQPAPSAGTGVTAFPATGAMSGANASPSPPTVRRLNLNQAGLRELMDLPGVGPTRAKAIIDHRDSTGPFQSVDDLDKVKGIGAVALERLRPLVTVDHPPGQDATGDHRAGLGGPSPEPPGVEGGYRGRRPAAAVLPAIERTAEPRPIGTTNNTKPTLDNPSPRTLNPGAVSQRAVRPMGPVNINTASQAELESLAGIGPALARRVIEHRAVHGPFQSPEMITAVKGIGPKIFERNRARIVVR